MVLRGWFPCRGGVWVDQLVGRGRTGLDRFVYDLLQLRINLGHHSPCRRVRTGSCEPLQVPQESLTCCAIFVCRLRHCLEIAGGMFYASQKAVVFRDLTRLKRQAFHFRW